MPKLNTTMKIYKINQIFDGEFNLLMSKRKKELWNQSEVNL